MLCAPVVASALLLASAEPPPRAVREPDVHVTPVWLGTQLIPSPGVGWGRSETHWVLGWQVTPVLFAFRLDPRLSPWRWWVAEPIVRHSGSLELFWAPELRGLPGAHFDHRAGLRSTLPLMERGDVLSLSLATALQHSRDALSPSYELSLNTLFGFLGLAGIYAPTDPRRRWTVTLRVRVF